MDYFPILALVAFGAVVAAAIIVLDLLLGPRRPDPVKNSVYECGNPAERIRGSARERFHVRFFLVGLLFLVFDLAAVLIYPLAVSFRAERLPAAGLILAFLVPLAVVYVWIWRKGALEWE